MTGDRSIPPRLSAVQAGLSRGQPGQGPDLALVGKVERGGMPKKDTSSSVPYRLSALLFAEGVVTRRKMQKGGRRGGGGGEGEGLSMSSIPALQLQACRGIPKGTCPSVGHCS